MLTALAFESVTKRYRNGVVALNGANWSIPVGARTCLLGPNGAGKSTAIRLVEGALRPPSGSVTLLGESRQLTKRALAVRCFFLEERGLERVSARPPARVNPSRYVRPT